MARKEGIGMDVGRGGIGSIFSMIFVQFFMAKYLRFCLPDWRTPKRPLSRVVAAPSSGPGSGSDLLIFPRR